MKVELFEQDVTFGSIPYGTCFKHADAVYMRVEGRGSLEEQCAVRFTDGKLIKFTQPQVKVQPLNLKVVEDK